MRNEDLDDAATVSAAAFDVDLSDEPSERLWRHRVGYPLGTDPNGAFVAELDREIVAVAQALRRERVWCLSMLAVHPGAQGVGAGRAVLGPALTYGADADAGLIPSSNDPRAMRLYALSGFALLPTFAAAGELDRRAIPRVDNAITEADNSGLERLAPISRDVRGAPHTSELRYALERGSRILTISDRGFTVVHSGRVWLLAARDEEAATSLLWRALELASSQAGLVSARWITGGQQWALRVLLAAGLRLSVHGAFCVRGAPGPLSPYLPSPPFA